MTLNNLRTTNPELAKLVVEQVYDNALIAAGLSDDSRTMVGRLNILLEKLLTSSLKTTEGKADKIKE